MSKAKIKKRLEDMPLSTYVVVSIVMVIIYTIVEMIVSSFTGVSHDTLTTCFYATFGGEILACALIKIFKLKEENENGDYEADDGK